MNIEAPHAAAILTLADVEQEPLLPGEFCSNPEGHEWVFTGTAYGGDDESHNGEGRSYCLHCGADGDA